MTEDLPLTYELADNSNFQLNDDLSLLNLMVNDISVHTIKQHHGVIDTLGFIINNTFAYCTDVVSFPKKSLECLYNLNTIINTINIIFSKGKQKIN